MIVPDRSSGGVTVLGLQGNIKLDEDEWFDDEAPVIRSFSASV
jgi:hypothetical protein